MSVYGSVVRESCSYEIIEECFFYELAYNKISVRVARRSSIF